MDGTSRVLSMGAEVRKMKGAEATQLGGHNPNASFSHTDASSVRDGQA